MMCQGLIRENLEDMYHNRSKKTYFVCTSVTFSSSVSRAVLTIVNLSPQGVEQSQQVDFEVLPDEERQCYKCRTTCYLSGITCACSPSKMVCLYHTQDLCSCPRSNLTLQ